MENILTAKEWLKTVVLTKGCADPDTMERYANYKTQMLEAKIFQFKQILNFLHGMYNLYSPGYSVFEIIKKDYDKHFNITSVREGKINQDETK